MSQQNQEVPSIIETPEILKDHYCYTQLLGEGSNGRSWLARCFDTGNDVAIKELKNFDALKQLELFQRESEVLASIHVKGVPELYDSVTSESGACYLIEEYIPYPSLQAILDTGKDFHEFLVLKIMRSVSLILQKLETQYTPPIIHRDIKPSNILCNLLPGGDLESYLIDFGAVTHPEKRDGGSTIAGTFGYMAPEQYQGKADIRSDYYALGATALHLLTHKSPYEMDMKGVFDLNYEQYLPEMVSSGTRNLLKALLSPQPETRPKDSQALLEAIDQAERASTQFTYQSSTARFWKKLKSIFTTSKDNMSQSSSEDDIDLSQINEQKIVWGQTKAHIERIISDESLIEYSYTADNTFHSGFLTIDDLDNIDIELASNSNSPEIDKFMIEYSKKQPYLNIVLSGKIILSKKLHDAYKELNIPFTLHDLIIAPQKRLIPCFNTLISYHTHHLFKIDPSDNYAIMKRPIIPGFQAQAKAIQLIEPLDYAAIYLYESIKNRFYLFSKLFAYYLQESSFYSNLANDTQFLIYSRRFCKDTVVKYPLLNRRNLINRNKSQLSDLYGVLYKCIALGFNNIIDDHIYDNLTAQEANRLMSQSMSIHTAMALHNNFALSIAPSNDSENTLKLTELINSFASNQALFERYNHHFCDLFGEIVQPLVKLTREIGKIIVKDANLHDKVVDGLRENYDTLFKLIFTLENKYTDYKIMLNMYITEDDSLKGIDLLLGKNNVLDYSEDIVKKLIAYWKWIASYRFINTHTVINDLLEVLIGF